MNRSDKIYVAGHRGMVGSALWRILEGRGFTRNFIRVDKKIFLTCPDDSIDYAVMEKEVQSGSYLGENDIVRLEDRYGRVE